MNNSKSRKLSTQNFKKVVQFIKTKARDVDKELYSFSFEDGPSRNVLDHLAEYQNSDGGFGHGLEPDFTTPSSSAIGTCLALQYLEKLNLQEDSKLVRGALNFLTTSYSKELERWHPVPTDVNDYPHAPWWHIDEKTSHCPIEASWENPTIEVIGYLHAYKNNFDKSTLKKLTDKAIDSLMHYSGKMESEHTLYCYLSFFSNTSQPIRNQIFTKLSELILATVNPNPNDWTTKYVPKPLQFVNHPDSPFYPLLKELIDQQLDMLIDIVDSSDAWYPTWSWGSYETDWQKAKIEWAGKIAVENLIVLRQFNRIEGILREV